MLGFMLQPNLLDWLRQPLNFTLCLMRALTTKLCRYFLPRVLARKCESTIPRSGEKGERVNCFTVSIDKAGAPYLIALELYGDQLKCIEWNGQRYEIDTTVTLSTIDPSQFHITHYYGLSEVRYFGVVDFVIGRLTLWPYIKIPFVRTLSKFDQYLFNKKKLVTKQRVDLLRFLVSQALEGHDSFKEIDLMTQLYSIKWVLHPDQDSQRKKLKFYLESLVDTGELRKADHKYFLTGHALRAIEEYEEQERKHTENVKMQWRMFWLALTIVFLTLVQAGLVKLPPLIDFTPESSASKAGLTNKVRSCEATI